MNTKNIVISSLILASFLTPSLAKAQVTSVELASQLDSLKAQLIEMLLAQIASLQVEIAKLVAQQTATQVQIAKVEEKVTQPVLGGATAYVPLKIQRVKATSPINWLSYLKARAVGASFDKTGFENTSVVVTANKKIDPSKVKVLVDGEVQNHIITSTRVEGNTTYLNLSPSLYAFGTWNEALTYYSANIKFEFTDEDGEVYTTSPLNCTAEYRTVGDTRYWYISNNLCHEGDFPIND